VALYQKDAGVWKLCQRPYVKRNGVWVAVQEAYVKRSGVWTKAYEYDITPPPQPEISTEIIEAFSGGIATTRYIKVGLRMPGGVHSPEIKQIRLLTTYNGGQPTTQFGGTYWTPSDNGYPSETWSDWKYGIYGVHDDTSNWQYKQWPVNAAAGTVLTADKTYYFSAWAMDDNGNWSGATHASVYIPKPTVNTPNIVTREAYFQPNTAGSYRGETDAWSDGQLLQQKSPRSIGMWFYGNQIIESVGATTVRSGSVNVTKAQIYIKRMNDEGSASAYMTLFWTGIGTPGTLPDNGPAKQELTNIGQLAKGEGQWFDMPLGFRNNFNEQIRALGLDWKRPSQTDASPADFSRVANLANAPSCGKIHLVWQEEA
jgi:hypothetical protein